MRRNLPRILGGVIAVVGIVLLAGFPALFPGSAPPDVDIPEIPAPAPLPPISDGPVRLVLRDIALARDGVRITADGAEAVLSLDHEPRIRIRRLVLDRPVLTAAPAPPEQAGPGTRLPLALPAPDRLFETLDLPSVRADTVRVRDGRVRRAAEGGQRWATDLRDIDLRLTDLRLGGDGPERASFRLDLVGTHRGRPLRIRSLAGSARRTADRLEFAVRGMLSATRGGVTGLISPDRQRLAIDLDSVAFTELHPWIDGLPRRGGGRFHGSLRSTADRQLVVIDTAAGRWPGAKLTASGELVVGGDPAARDLVIRIAELDPDALGLELPDPLQGRLAGVVRADGPAGAIRLDADLRHLGDDEVTAISADGTVELTTGDPRMRLRIAAGSLLVADADLAVRPTDRPAPSTSATESSFPALAALLQGRRSPVTEGTIHLRMEPTPLGLDPGPRLHAHLAGTLADDTLAATARLDSLPLRLLPFDVDLEGTATAALDLGGSLDAPLAGGTIRLKGTAYVPGHPDLSGGGTVHLRDGALRFDDVRFRAGDGELRLRGSIAPGPVFGVRIHGAAGGRRVDLTMELDSLLVLDERLARVRVSGSLRLRGDPDSLVVSGRLLPSGHLREDYFASDPSLDAGDPAFADLAARAPWPAGGRLAALTGAGPARSDGAAGAAGSDGTTRGGRVPWLPSVGDLTGEVVVEVTHALRLLDEDSELQGTGEIRLVLDKGIRTAGIVALEKGFYTQFAQRFLVYGGALDFDGPGLMPRFALRSDYDDEALLIGDDRARPWPERFPPFQFFGYGEAGRAPTGGASEQTLRYTVLPRTQLEMARRILMGSDVQPVGDWREELWWLGDDGAGLVGGRALSQGIPLGWSFMADRLYDYLPLDVGYFATGVVMAGPDYPGRVVVAPVLRGALVLGDGWELRGSQPLVGVAPEFTAVYRRRHLRFEAFAGQRFDAGPAVGRDAPGYLTRRRIGVGVRWSREY